jgi:hypothetical protein
MQVTLSCFLDSVVTIHLGKTLEEMNEVFGDELIDDAVDSTGIQSLTAAAPCSEK